MGGEGAKVASGAGVVTVYALTAYIDWTFRVERLNRSNQMRVRKKHGEPAHSGVFFKTVLRIFYDVSGPSGGSGNTVHASKIPWNIEAFQIKKNMFHQRAP